MRRANFLNGWQVIHPKEVTMRKSKTALLVLALTAIVLTAWAGNTTVTRKARSDKDDGAVVAQVQPAREDEKPDQATQSKPKEDQAPRSNDRNVQAPEHRSDEAQTPRSEHNAVRAPESKPEAIRNPSSSEQRDRSYTEPASIRPEQTDHGTSNAGEINIPQRGGEPDPGRRRDGGSGGYGGGRGPGGGHYRGGQGWHGPHDQWRHQHYRDHGSWSFLFYYGPRIYYAPIHYPHIIRIPHNRVGVYVRYTGDDYVGSQFAESVREHLREQGLRLVYSQDDARLELYIISMEQDQNDPGYGSSVSVSYIWYPGNKFITAQMVDAGLDEVDDLAQSVADYAGDLVDEYR
jgi:hypothetical protein